MYPSPRAAAEGAEIVIAIVRDSDAQWAHLVRWVVFSTIAAEELGLDSSNVDEMMKSSTNPEVKRLLGVSDDLGQKLGLPRAWALR